MNYSTAKRLNQLRVLQADIASEVKSRGLKEVGSDQLLRSLCDVIRMMEADEKELSKRKRK